jgi:small GTP-binding protein
MAPLCKIVILGSGGVGKSAITAQFVNKVFIEKYDPTIEDSYRKHHEVDGEPVVLEILDTAGTEQFTAMRNLYLKNSEGFIIVFSLTEYATFLEIEDLRDQVLRVKECANPPMLLIGNKADLIEDRKVPMEEIQTIIKKWKAPYLEVSAKLNTNVVEAFETITRLVFKANSGNTQKKKMSCSLL